jgi:23S rRNA pseudouridine1911/1915/1917 synthase
VPRPPQGRVDAPLSPVHARRSDRPKTVVDPAGRPAVTEYELVEARAERALLRVRIRTGRTHQIRAHLAHLGHPIVGDRRYGSPEQLGALLMLHAAELALEHPVTGEALRVSAPPPAVFGAPSS